MALAEEFEKSGNWLFRWRSYPPLLVVALGLIALKDYGHPAGAHRLWEALCVAVSFLGLGIRAHAVGYAASGTSGRNTTKQLAKALNTTGMYSVVRHPLYLGNFFMWLGISMFLRSGWFILVVALIFWVYYERIMFAEEAYLRRSFGDVFVKWAEDTPAFIPRLKNWRPPEGTFKLKTVLKREQSGLLAIAAIFTLLEVAGDYVASGRLSIEPAWAVFFGLSLIVFLALTGLKKARLL